MIKSPVLKQLHDNGFNPIAITTMMCEETFVFQTEEESHKAAKFINPEMSDDGMKGCHYGFWYSLEEGKYNLQKAIEHHQITFGYEPEITWL